ncbi:MAG: WXG100 family type VII secretion target [Blautia sp.]
MATFRVTTNELKAKAEELRTLNAQFKNEVGNMETLENSLSGMWEGEAKAAFHNAFSSDKVQMDNFYNAIEVYIQRLEAAAVKYAQAEATNVEIASTRKYK